MDDRRRLAIVGADLSTKMVVLETCSGAFDIDPVESRPDLLDHLRERPPAVLLLDADMPHVDAFGVLAQVRKIPELKTTIPLVLVPLDKIDLAQEARKLGADDVVTKPVDGGDLKARIEGALARHREVSEGRTRVGTLLMDAGVITPGQLEAALGMQEEEGGRLGGIFVREGFCTEHDLAASLALQMDIPFVDLQSQEPATEAIAVLARDFIMRHRVMPLKLDDRDNLTLAMTNPLDTVAIDEAALRSGKRVLPVICTESDFDEAVTTYLSRRQRPPDGAHAAEAGTAATAEPDAEIVRLVDRLISEAARMRASDVHLEPTTGGMHVRCRIDGVLHDLRELEPAETAAVVSRLKSMGGMDVAETRLPQDGRSSFRTLSGDRLDLRLASIPSLHGESIFIRLLDVSVGIPTLDELGMAGAPRTRYAAAVSRSQGGLIVCGPTGSGKTTTLYATLQSINSPSRRICTVEDPIERSLEGVTQTEVQEQIGLTFSRSLQALLRTDPDVIMVGEIRDLETAEMVAESAVSGRLVFTTIDARDAAAAPFRLIDLGLPPQKVAAAFGCVVAQRLVRRLCPSCRRKVSMPADRWEALGLGPAPALTVTVGEPAGCERCLGTGYLGRVAVFEVLTIEGEIAQALLAGQAEDVRRLAGAHEMATLLQDGITKILGGVTSISELARVTR